MASSWDTVGCPDADRGAASSRGHAAHVVHNVWAGRVRLAPAAGGGRTFVPAADHA